MATVMANLQVCFLSLTFEVIILFLNIFMRCDHLKPTSSWDLVNSNPVFFRSLFIQSGHSSYLFSANHTCLRVCWRNRLPHWLWSCWIGQWPPISDRCSSFFSLMQWIFHIQFVIVKSSPPSLGVASHQDPAHASISNESTPCSNEEPRAPKCFCGDDALR